MRCISDKRELANKHSQTPTDTHTHSVREAGRHTYTDRQTDRQTNKEHLRTGNGGKKKNRVKGKNKY